MPLDLSALDAPTASQDDAAASGKPLSVRVDHITADPNQPRKEFSSEKAAEMEASIREHGVLQPVSVRPDPNQDGRYILNFGERRWRGAKDAGLNEIPVFITEQFTDYGQVIENLQRDDLKPLELALFIARRKSEGDKSKDIAKRLGIDPSQITNHLSLIDPPPSIGALYASGKVVDAKSIYELRRLHEKHPDQVEAWITSGVEISRSAIINFGDTLKPESEQRKTKQKPSTGSNSGEVGTSSGDGAGKNLGHVQENSTGTGSEGNQTPVASSSKSGADAPSGTGDVANQIPEPRDTGDLTSWPRGKGVADPNLMKRPLLIVVHDGRAAAVLLNRRPSEFGLLRIKYEDNGEEAEVSAGLCTINQLTDEAK